MEPSQQNHESDAEELSQKGQESKVRRKEIIMIVIGTLISLILTQILSGIVKDIQRVRNRRMSAMMVMTNIESFARMLDNRSDAMAHADTVGTWLLAQPLEHLDTMPEDELGDLIDAAIDLRFFNHDRTAEHIFESTIDTWDNMANVEFIDKVGQCFASINTVEEYWNDWANEVGALQKEILGNPDNYPGTNKSSKLIHNSEMRHYIARIHNWRGWMKYVAATMRFHNRENMRAIDISEKELKEFINKLSKDVRNGEKPPVVHDYYMPALNPDSLNTMPPIMKRD